MTAEAPAAGTVPPLPLSGHKVAAAAASEDTEAEPLVVDEEQNQPRATDQQQQQQARRQIDHEQRGPPPGGGGGGRTNTGAAAASAADTNNNGKAEAGNGSGRLNSVTNMNKKTSEETSVRTTALLAPSGNNSGGDGQVDGFTTEAASSSGSANPVGLAAGQLVVPPDGQVDETPCIAIRETGEGELYTTYSGNCTLPTQVTVHYLTR